MKKFIIQVLLLSAFCVLFSVAFCMTVDPYNVFHWSCLTDNGVEPNKNYIKMKYVLDNPEKFDSFMFGSSRVGSIHVEKLSDVHCYNMTYSQGIPAEHLANIETMIGAGIEPRRIYMGVDNLSYTYDPASHNTEPVRCPYEYLMEHPEQFISHYLNPSIAFQSLETTMSNRQKTEDYAKNFYDYGAWNYYGGVTLAEQTQPLVPSTGNVNRMEETLEEIAQIATLCQEHNIELVLFTNPLCDVTYEAALEQDYLVFLRRLADVNPYYNFSGMNEVSMDYTNFVDTSHYTAFVGDMMIDCMENGIVDEKLYEQGFGVYVTEENADSLIRRIGNEL